MKGFIEAKFWQRVQIADRIVCLKNNADARRAITATPAEKPTPKAPEMNDHQKQIFQAYVKFRSSWDYNEPITSKEKQAYSMLKMKEASDDLNLEHDMQLQEYQDQLAMQSNENVALAEQLKQTKMKLKAAREEIDELKKQAAENSLAQTDREKATQKRNFENKLKAMQRDYDEKVKEACKEVERKSEKKLKAIQEEHEKTIKEKNIKYKNLRESIQNAMKLNESLQN
jgi:hypothetical protein